MSVRNFPEGPHIFLDMDGVIADFDRACKEQQKTPHELKLTPGAYVNLPPMPGAIDGIHELIKLGYFVMILTKIPSKNPYASVEKMIWLNRELPVLKDNIIITPNKGCVGSPKDFLVDDHPEWANAHNFSGTIVHFNCPESIIRDWSDLVLYFTSIKFPN